VMRGRIMTEAELQRANIAVAWSFAHLMTPEQYDRLCEMTVQSFRELADQEGPYVE
jgi:hypothetical protein